MSHDNTELGPQTRAVHTPVLDLRSTSGDALAVPIVQTSSFGFPSVEAMESALCNPGTGYMYSRAQNPTVDAMERGVAAFEGTEAAVGFSSGMAAIHAAILAELSSGDHMVAPASMYGGAYALFTRVLPKMGIEVSFVADASVRGFEAAIKPNTRILYTESIGNPRLAVPNLSAMAELARANDARLLVDSTLAPPPVCQPIASGADLVIHSASKYYGGHGDLIGGLVAGAKSQVQKVRHIMFDVGGCMAPFVAFLVLRGMKTLPIRMRQHQESALQVARFLEQQPAIETCLYPGLESHPDHTHAKASLSGFGAVVAAELKGGDDAASRLANQLRLFERAGSLGDAHSLVIQPAMASHRALSPEQRAEAGIHPGFLRFSIGLEDGQDLVADLRRALAAV